MSNKITLTLIKYEKQYGNINSWSPAILNQFHQAIHLKKFGGSYANDTEVDTYHQKSLIYKNQPVHFIYNPIYKIGDWIKDFQVHNAKGNIKKIDKFSAVIQNHLEWEVALLLHHNFSILNILQKGYSPSLVKRTRQGIDFNSNTYPAYAYEKNGVIQVYAISKVDLVNSLKKCGMNVDLKTITTSLNEQSGVLNQGLIRRVNLTRFVYLIDANNVILNILPGTVKITDVDKVNKKK